MWTEKWWNLEEMKYNARRCWLLCEVYASGKYEAAAAASINFFCQTLVLQLHSYPRDSDGMGWAGPFCVTGQLLRYVLLVIKKVYRAVVQFPNNNKDFGIFFFLKEAFGILIIFLIKTFFYFKSVFWKSM